MFAGTTVADSNNALVMEEEGHPPVFYIPKQEVRMDLMTGTSQSSR